MPFYQFKWLSSQEYLELSGFLSIKNHGQNHLVSTIEVYFPYLIFIDKLLLSIRFKSYVYKDLKILLEESFDYNGKIAHAGIHYDYDSTRSAKKMEKQAKREKKLAERRAKRLAKDTTKKDSI